MKISGKTDQSSPPPTQTINTITTTTDTTAGLDTPPLPPPPPKTTNDNNEMQPSDKDLAAVQFLCALLADSISYDASVPQVVEQQDAVWKVQCFLLNYKRYMSADSLLEATIRLSGLRLKAKQRRKSVASTAAAVASSDDSVSTPYAAAALCMLRLWVETRFTADFYHSPKRTTKLCALLHRIHVMLQACARVQSSASSSSSSSPSPLRAPHVQVVAIQFARLELALIRHHPKLNPSKAHLLVPVFYKYRQGSPAEMPAQVPSLFLSSSSSSGGGGGGNAQQNKPIFSYHPKLIAQALTYIDQQLMQRVLVEDFCDKNWMRRETSPRVSALAERATLLSEWIASSILLQSSPSARLRVYQQAIRIAYFMHQEHNFFGTCYIASGLRQWCVSRLFSTNSSSSSGKRTAADASAPSTSVRTQIDEETRIMLIAVSNHINPNGNYKTYRDVFSKLMREKKMLIPNVPVLLYDLTHLEEAPNVREATAGTSSAAALPNMDKLCSIGDQIYLQFFHHQRASWEAQHAPSLPFASKLPINVAAGMQNSNSSSSSAVSNNNHSSVEFRELVERLQNLRAFSPEELERRSLAIRPLTLPNNTTAAVPSDTPLDDSNSFVEEASSQEDQTAAGLATSRSVDTVNNSSIASRSSSSSIPISSVSSSSSSSSSHNGSDATAVAAPRSPTHKSTTETTSDDLQDM